jgi:hypothetical protein
MDIKALAQRASAIAQLPAEWIEAQWRHETGDFTSELVADNNFGGMKDYWGNYKTFSSPEVFADEFGQYLTLYREDGIYDAVTVDQYVSALKNGGYFTDNYDNYVNGVKRFLSAQSDTTYIPGTQNLKNPTWFQKLASRINSPLSFEKTIPESQKQQQGWIDQGKELLIKGTKAIGLVLVGLVLTVFGVYLLQKDNTVIMKSEKEGE